MTLQYVTGGTMPAQALSYVMRDPDWLLRTKLQQGEFCYVLTPRQMGKSSLMIQTAVYLQTNAVTPAIIDLTALGQVLDASQWYNGLLDTLAERLDLEDEIEAFKRSHASDSPLQRWQKALRHVFLEHTSGPLVIFIDEIDATRSLLFSTDEFFAAIRACYNARTQDGTYNRLTFCLLGVAAPTDLINDRRLTPFNIGTRVDLQDFTQAEAAPLRLGLGHDDATNRLSMERIYYWTDGHPYLTQRLCQAVASDSANLTQTQVDAICRDLFLNAEKGMRDDNLLYVRQRMLSKNEAECASLLTLYRQIWDGKLVLNNETDSLVGQLKLSGAVRAEGGRLQVRNRIYRQVFDRKWITEQMPDAEKQRLRAAYQLGILRAATVTVVLLGILGGLAFTAYYQFLRARDAEKLAKLKDHFVYNTDMILAQQAYDHHEYGNLSHLLREHLPNAGDKEDLRGWEWGYYWRLMHQDRYSFMHAGKNIVYSAAFSPDGKMLASADGAGIIKLWDTAAAKEIIPEITGDGGAVYTLAFCPTNKRLLASGGASKTVELWDVVSRHVTTAFRCRNEIFSLAFSPNGRFLAIGCKHGKMDLWDVPAHRSIARQIFQNEKMAKNPNADVLSVAFSPDSAWLAATSSFGRFKLLKAPFLQSTDLSTLSPATPLYSVAFSPDNRTLVVGRQDGSTEIWDITTKHRKGIIRANVDNVSGLTFSNDKYLAIGSWDHTVRLWNIEKRRIVHAFIGHTNRVTNIAFSPDGKVLASCAGNEIKLWNPKHWDQNPTVLKAATNQVGQKEHRALLLSSNGTVWQLVRDWKSNTVTLVNLRNRRELRRWTVSADTNGAAVSPDGNTVALGLGDGTVTLHDAQSWKEKWRFSPVLPSEVGVHNEASHLAFSPDGKVLAVACGDPAVVTLWNTSSQQQIAHFQHTNAAEGIAFSPRGEMLAIANWQGFVYLWNIAARSGNIHATNLVRWQAHSKAVTDVAFSHDGKTLATSSEDHTVKLWNIATQREMITLRDHTKSVQGVVFSPDGRALAENVNNLRQPSINFTVVKSLLVRLLPERFQAG